MTTEVQAYLGSGPVYLRDRAGTGGLIYQGSISELKFAIETDKKTMPDSTTPGGGELASVERIKGVKIDMTMDELTLDNITRSLYGTGSTEVAGTATDEVIVAKLDALVPLAHAGATAHVVKNSAGTTTYVLGTDYEAKGAGIIPLSTGAITADQSLKASYSYPAQDVVHALKGGAIEVELLFDGFNEARLNKTFMIRAHRVKFGPAKELSVIADAFGKLSVSGSLLKDTAQAVGISQYFTTRSVA